MLLVDLHVHTTVSFDGRSSKEALAKAAAKRGLDAVVITDHDAATLDAPQRCEGVWLLPGCEISTDAGHILGLFYNKKPDIASLRKHGPAPVADALAALRECGAVTVLAHPFESDDAMPDVPVDCIESENSRVYIRNSRGNAQARDLAAAMGLPETGGSDAHSDKEVGNAYTIIDASDCSPDAMREALLEGRCTPVAVRNTPRRMKGFSQLRGALRSHKIKRVLVSLAYVGYCFVKDTFAH